MTPNRKRCRIYFNEDQIYLVLKIINKHCWEHIKMRLIVNNCEELDSPSIWYAHLDATEYEWTLITQDLDAIGNTAIIDRPQTPQYVMYFRKNREDD